MPDSSSLKESLRSLEHTLLPYFTEKIPSLPIDIKKILVQLAPIFAIISVVLGVVQILVLVGLGTLLAPISVLFGMRPAGVFQMNYLITILFLVPITILEAMAIGKLTERKKIGWNFLFYAVLLQIASNIIEFNILGAVIMGVINFYLLFQIREYFT